jgi:hypothetical protein
LQIEVLLKTPGTLKTKQAPSTIETEQVVIAICPADEIVPKDLGGFIS